MSDYLADLDGDQGIDEMVRVRELEARLQAAEQVVEAAQRASHDSEELADALNAYEAVWGRAQQP